MRPWQGREARHSLSVPSPRSPEWRSPRRGEGDQATNRSATWQGCIKLGSGRLAEACTSAKHGRFGETSLPTLG